MPEHDLADLGELEREVLLLVWRQGTATADTVRGALTRPLKESTVRTVLRRLEDKGHLSHTVDGRTFVYRGAESRGRAAARAVKRIADWFCEGSLAGSRRGPGGRRNARPQGARAARREGLHSQERITQMMTPLVEAALRSLALAVRWGWVTRSRAVRSPHIAKAFGRPSCWSHWRCPS